MYRKYSQQQQTNACSAINKHQRELLHLHAESSLSLGTKCFTALDEIVLFTLAIQIDQM